MFDDASFAVLLAPRFLSLTIISGLWHTNSCLTMPDSVVVSWGNSSAVRRPHVQARPSPSLMAEGRFLPKTFSFFDLCLEQETVRVLCLLCWMPRRVLWSREAGWGAPSVSLKSCVTEGEGDGGTKVGRLREEWKKKPAEVRPHALLQLIQLQVFYCYWLQVWMCVCVQRLTSCRTVL